MHRSIRLAIAFLGAVLAGHPANGATEASFSVAVLVDGTPVPEFAARGRIYVEALKGKEFVIRLFNPTAERIAVALSIDGRNVIDARRTTAGSAAKWIIGPGQTAEIPGWQVSGDTARRFFFTETSKSYARWLGDTANVGTIEAVFFRELRRLQSPTASGDIRKDESIEGGAGQSPPEGPLPAESGAARNEASKQSSASDRYAATGIGGRTSFPVRWAAFDQDPTPAARIAIRYEFRPELVRLGVLPRGERELFARDGAKGFEYGYAPDPYR